MQKPGPLPGCGRAGAWDAVHGRAAESAQADFAILQRRIHSLPRAGGTLPDQFRNGHHSLPQGDGTLPDQTRTASSAPGVGGSPPDRSRSASIP